MKTLLTTLLAAIALLAVACSDDDPVDCGDCGVFPPEPPSSRTAVLNNLEVSYNRRQINKYQELLDQNFVFYFYSGDVGGNIPAQWGRQEEISAHTHIFDPNYLDNDPSDGVQEAVTRITMDVRWEDGLQWQKVAQDSEDWYTATVFYNFQFDVGEDDHFVNNPGAKAQFTVRNAGTEEAPHWQLVEMRDLGGNSSMAAAVSTDQSTWGHLKAAYR